MPPEPKRPIEELLEASAKARRAEFGADPAMPNPMRARLHEEIARQSRGNEAPARRSWLGIFWPQISIATVLAAVLVTGAVMWLGHGSEDHSAMPLAMNAPAERGADATDVLKSLEIPKDMPVKSEAAPAQALSTIGGSLAQTETPTLDENKTNALFAPGAPASAPATKEPAGQMEVIGGSSSIKIASDRSDKFADTASLMAAPQMMENRHAASANLQQNFSQTTRGQNLRNNANAKRAVANILDSFQFEQDGRAVRVVDADGSTYTGKFEPVALSQAPRLPKQSVSSAGAPASKAAKEAVQSNEQFFRASGYNSSLKKQVVFEGNYIPLSKVLKKAQKSDGTEQAPARIVGEAKVPGEPPVAVDAATVTP